MRTNVLLAIFKRNFVSYFASPIGYVFICAFVLLTAIAAFWPNEFFNSNLANLEQLNEKLPWILLVFVPAITMSIWADERRQGTDELLLTLPATDFEVVLGKYLAGVAIFTISLLFSLSNLFVLEGLGDPDLGLVLANYVGYWLTGSAMIAVGVVASFLTSNLTVAFVLAAAFNAPLVFARAADAIIPWEQGAIFVKGLSISARFDDFSRGVVTLSSVVYFLSIIVVMLYLCMVLIGRRHWVVRSASVPMSAHYGVRAIALVAVAVGVNVLAMRFDTRVDTTSERLSTVSPQTKTLLQGLDPDRPVFIEAYISPAVPEMFVQARLNLLSKLREVDSLGGDAVVVRVNDTRRFSREASEAEEQFGILPREVPSSAGGRIALEQIHLGVAVMSGLDKVVIPFFDRGLPVEYELVRSIATVSQQKRRRIGVIETDAELFGGLDMQTFRSRPTEQIIVELQKQYEVVPLLNKQQAIPDDFDALLCVQPSSLTQPQMDNFLAAIRRGTPVAIFEDPFPFLNTRAPGTSEPRRPQTSNPFQQAPPPEPKGDIRELWALLGVSFTDRTVVWDDYNPYPKIQEFYPEFVFVSPGAGNPEAFNPNSEITRGLGTVLTLFPGSISETLGGGTNVEPLLHAGRQTGIVAFDEILRRGMFGQASLNPQRRHVPTGEPYVLATHITGTLPPAPVADGETPPAPTPLDVVLVADIDVLQSAFFMVRAAGQDTGGPVSFDFDNVTFLLNILDTLAGDDRFIAVRRHRPRHRTLTAVEERTELARAAAAAERRRFEEGFEQQRDEEQASLNAELAELQARAGDAREMALELQMMTEVGQNRLDARIEQLERDRDREMARIERDLALEVRQVQNTYKLAAVGLPPIPPLLVAVVVWLRRRTLERIGVPATRLRTAAA